MNNRFVNLTKTFMKETFRNKLDIFFTMLFPVLFIIIFGNLFMLGGNGEEAWDIGIAGEYESDIEAYFSPHEMATYDSEVELQQALEDGAVDVGVHLREETATVYLLESFQSMGEGIFLQQFVENAIRKYAIDFEEEITTVEDQLVAAGDVEAFEIDYLVTGIMGLSLLSGGMFATIGVFGRYKKQGVIKRFMATPMKPWEFVVSASLTKVLLNFLSILVIVYLARFLYGVTLGFHWGIFLIIILTSSIGMMGFGVLVLLVFKKTETALTGASILYVIMTFFSGVYFPVAFIPDQFQWVSRLLPVTYIIDVLRYGAGIETMSRAYFISLNLAFVAIGGVLLVFASKKFVSVEKQ